MDGQIGEVFEVAGLHPASDSTLVYLLGHVMPVPSETGRSYGDLDNQFLLASYRVHMDEAQAKRVFAYIKRLQASRPVWNAALYNCVSFIQDIAQEMGLRVPGNHMLNPDVWVNQLRALNGGGRTARSRSMARTEERPSAPPSAAQRPSAPARAGQRPPPRAAVARERDRLTDVY